MPDTDIGNAIASDLTNSVTDYSVNSVLTDGQQDQDETTWQNENWAQYLGYYKNIPELQTAIDAHACWTMGAGFEADEITQLVLNNISGNGKESFNTILSNMIRTFTIGGDAFAEIIRDDDGVLVNLKPLDPSSIVIVQDRKGRIKRYEQVSRAKQPNKRLHPIKCFIYQGIVWLTRYMV